MTVAELIEELKKHPPAASVVVMDDLWENTEVFVEIEDGAVFIRSA